MYRRMGLHEVPNEASLIDFFKIGRFIGDPASLPWCRDAVESCIAKVLPAEPLPSTFFWAQGWASFGIDGKVPLVGSIGVIRWSAKYGHVGFVAGVDGGKVCYSAETRQTLSRSPISRATSSSPCRLPRTYPIKLNRSGFTGDPGSRAIGSTASRRPGNSPLKAIIS
jgi:hypothetical protein